MELGGRRLLITGPWGMFNYRRLNQANFMNDRNPGARGIIDDASGQARPSGGEGGSSSAGLGGIGRQPYEEREAPRGKDNSHTQRRGIA